MNNVFSLSLGLAGAIALLATTGCQGTETGGQNAAALGAGMDQDPSVPEPGEDGPMQDGPFGPHEPGDPGDPDHPGDPGFPGEPCEDIGGQIGLCYETQISECEPYLTDLELCQQTLFQPCEALLDQLLACEIDGQRDCEQLRIDVDVCSQNLGLACAPQEAIVDACFQSCFALEEELEFACGGEGICPEPPADTCGLLHQALGQCFAESPPGVCFIVEQALIEVCADGHEPPHPEEPGLPPGEEEWPPDEGDGEGEDELPPDPDNPGGF